MDNSHTGRKVKVGVAIEGTRGTAATAAQAWQKHLTANFYDRQEHQDNESAMGVDEKINDSEIQARWSDGTIGGKITADTFGYILSGRFGLPTSTAIGTTGAYSHVFRFSDVLTGLTVFRQSPVRDLKFARGTMGDFSVEANAKEFVTFSADLTAMKGVAATSTPAFTEEPEFSGKNVVVKTASTAAGIASAARMQLKSISLNIPRDVGAYFGLGNEEPDEIDADSIEINGSFVLRYRDDTQEAAWNNGTKQWLSIFMSNPAAAIGGEAPRVEFIMPKVSFREVTFSDDLDAKVDQTINFTAEFSSADARAIEAILVNSKASYTA